MPVRSFYPPTKSRYLFVTQDTETTSTPAPTAPIGVVSLLLRPRQTLSAFSTADHIPFTAMWSLISAAGIVFYTLLTIYPRAGFGFQDALITLALLSPFGGMVVFRLAGWILSKSGRFFGGKASPRLCQGALSAGLLPLGCSLIISLPLFFLYPDQPIRELEIAPIIALAQMIGTLWSLVNVVKAVSVIHQLKTLHAVVALLGMMGFMFATYNILSLFLK